jgi:hypothetical protein
MRRLTLLTLLAATALGTAARAATLYTAPASDGFADSRLHCQVRNVSASARTVTIEMLDFAGNSMNGASTQTIAPGEIAFMFNNTGSSASSCKFTVSGSAKNVRAVGIYYSDTTNRDTIAVLAE